MENENKRTEPLTSEQMEAKAAIVAECEKLAAAGITFVALHYDGYGDEGAAEDVKCYRSEDYAYMESEASNYDVSHLQEDFEMLIPFGYEDNLGGFGDVLLNVNAQAITVEQNDRFEDYTTSRYEV